jgi:hypothetical protein
VTELTPAELAFRVGALAGLLGILGWLPVNLQWMAAFALLIVALVYFYEIWAARGSPRRQRGALIWAVLALAGAGALIGEIVASVSTPLLALAAVCIALSVAATLGDSGGDAESETEH